MRWVKRAVVVFAVVVVVYSGLSFCLAEDQDQSPAPPVKIDEKAQAEHKWGTAPAVFMILFVVGLGFADRISDAIKRRHQAELIAQQYGYTVR
jgi:hypothetical protein